VPKYSIRVFGDPVLRERASEVTDVTDALVRLADDMVDTMRAAPGLGLMIGRYRPGPDRQPSSYSHSPLASLIVGLMIALGPSSLSGSS